MVQLNIDINSH